MKANPAAENIENPRWEKLYQLPTYSRQYQIYKFLFFQVCEKESVFDKLCFNEL